MKGHFRRRCGLADALRNAVTFDPLVRLASLFVLGASFMGLYALFRIATGRHERYTAPASVWPAPGPDTA